VVFLLGTAYEFDWHTVLLVIFVLLAMLQDTVRPPPPSPASLLTLSCSSFTIVGTILAPITPLARRQPSRR
jgi:hypothetical protein